MSRRSLGEYEGNIHLIPEKALSSDRLVRFCGVLDKLGYFVAKKYREDIKIPVLSEEENEKYALLTTIRRRPNLPWREKLGKTHYFMLRAESLIQVTIPISDNHLMLVYFDVDHENNYDKTIIDKILPAIASDGHSNIDRQIETR